MKINVINIQEKLATFNEYWKPHVVGELNGQLVKVAKLKGEFVMHHHDNEDELFQVIKGVLKMEMEDQVLTIHPGEFIIVPKGVPHRPIAEEEVHIMLFEPATTLNTGNVENNFTQRDLDAI